MDLEAASNEAGFELPIDRPLLEKIMTSKWYILLGFILTIIAVYGLIKKTVVREAVTKRIGYVIDKINNIMSRQDKK